MVFLVKHKLFAYWNPIYALAYIAVINYRRWEICELWNTAEICSQIDALRICTKCNIYQTKSLYNALWNICPRSVGFVLGSTWHTRWFRLVFFAASVIPVFFLIKKVHNLRNLNLTGEMNADLNFNSVLSGLKCFFFSLKYNYKNCFY